MDTAKTYKLLDDAVDVHLKATSGDGVFATGWVIIASVSSSAHDETNSDGYVTFTSEGLPHHSQIGLLKIALDDRSNIGLISLMGLAMDVDPDEDWEDE